MTVPPAPQISVVIPCLDEEAAVGTVVEQAWEGIMRSGRTGEVIVVDNGSTDRSAEIAADHGATVLFEPRRGYGRAYLTGIEHAQGEYVVMADADGTYPVQELGAFVERTQALVEQKRAEAEAKRAEAEQTIRKVCAKHVSDRSGEASLVIGLGRFVV